MTVRANSSGISMSLDDFRRVDYGQVCEHLGLRPSKPYHNAEGKYVGPRRKRKGRKGGRR